MSTCVYSWQALRIFKYKSLNTFICTINDTLLKIKIPLPKQEGTHEGTHVAFPLWSHPAAECEDILAFAMSGVESTCICLLFSQLPPVNRQNKASCLCWPRLVLSTQLPLTSSTGTRTFHWAPLHRSLKSCQGERTSEFYLLTISIVFFPYA